MERPRLPARLDSVLQRLAAAGLRAYLVGGAPRDLWLGREPRDYDVLVEQPLERAHAALPEAVSISARTPVLACLGSGPRIEITGLRTGAASLDEDLALRDFTLNALAWDAANVSWLDPLGGRADLDAGRLRACAPARGFRDDPVRVLRGVRLALELSLELEPETRRALERAHWRLATAPGERLREELFRLLALPDGRGTVEALRACGALAALLPELLRLVGVEQNRHHRDDVYRHSLAVCAELRAEPLLRLAALLHDSAKPESKAFRKGPDEASFHRHEHLAAAHVERVARRLRLSKSQEQRLDALVRHHLLFPERLESSRAVRRMLRRVGGDILPDLLELRRADLASRGPVPAAWDACEARIRELAQSERAEENLAISGEDVMRELGIEHGPAVGRWLARARRRVVEQPLENQRELLLDWLRAAAGRG
jgi:tRNA nucleotidyltransferase/poly(A) polymerase